MHFSQSKKRASENKEDKGGYDESIEVSKRGNGNNVFDVTLKSSKTVVRGSKNEQSHHPIDALLLAIVEEFSLDSLSISVSSVQASSSHRQKRFPVGTAVQFLVAGDQNYADSKITNKDSSSFEHNLLKLLSSKNLLCENIQFRNVKLMGSVVQPDGSTIIMLPNDAFALCHSSTLVDKIVSSSPCRHFLGVFSQVQTDLNKVDIVDRSAWVQVTRSQYGDKEEVYIEKGLGFGRIVNHPNVTLSRLLGGQVDAMQQPCRLARSSYIISRDSYGNEYLKQDLKEKAMDMQTQIVHKLKDSGNEKVLENSFGIEKRLIRVNGMAYAGTLQTRVFYNGHLCGSDVGGDSDSTCVDDAVDLKVVDVYPNIISPLYHTLKISLVEGHGAGDQFYSINPQLPTSSVNDDFTVTHFALDDLDFNITTGRLSLSKRVPKDSSLYIQIDFKPKYLQFEAFSADPNRGFDVPPSIAMLTYSQDFSSHVNTYSNALLIMPPVPDLSMPYNVISIVCTFFALIMGTTMNLTIRKSREGVVDQIKGEKGSKKSKRLKDKLKEKIGQVSKLFKGVRRSRNKEHKQKAE